MLKCQNPGHKRPPPVKQIKCQNPEQFVVFHKTHKCAGTSIQRILLRYAHKHNLTLVLPSNGVHLQFYIDEHVNNVNNTEWFKAGLIPNIFCLHSHHWSYSEVAKLMSKSLTKPVYFSILRDPVSVFMSAWDYYELSKRTTTWLKFSRPLSLEEFALMDNKPKVLHWNHLNFRDVSLYEFGLRVTDNDNMTAVEDKIEEIDQTFDLIMIVEHFEESMVLLKDLLCWPPQDMVSLKLNVHEESSKSTLSEKAKLKLKEWLKADYKLYDHFARKLKNEIQKIGSSEMSLELEAYRQWNKEAEAKCPLKFLPKSKLPREDRPWGAGVLGYQVLNKDHECQLMAMQELKFIDMLRNSQKKRALSSS